MLLLVLIASTDVFDKVVKIAIWVYKGIAKRLFKSIKYYLYRLNLSILFCFINTIVKYYNLANKAGNRFLSYDVFTGIN